MKVNIYPKTTTRFGVETYNAIIEGINACGDSVSVLDNNNLNSNCDLASIWSVLWQKPDRERIWNYYRSQNIDMLIPEVGCLKRNVYWKFGLNGINNDAFFNNHNCPADRWSQLNIPLRDWRHNGEYIIICGQNDRSGAWPRGISSEQWIIDTIKNIRKYSNRRILVRPHPRCPIKPLEILKIPKVEIDRPKMVGTIDEFNFEEQLKKAWAVVCHNSNPSVTAAIYGIPVFCDKSSLASPIGNLNLADIESPKMPDREQWAYNLAYCEWTNEELRSGLAWDHLRSGISK